VARSPPHGRRGGPQHLVDERDQVLHSGGVRSGQVELGVGGCEIGGRHARGEVSPAASGIGRGEALC
jgi:hypothetical protein